MKNLLLTLGHNSSVILVEDNHIVWGYETERVTGVKSDSRFPRAVFDYVLDNRYWDGQVDCAYVTHWAPDGALSSMGAKYWDPSFFENTPVRTLTADRTHHDTHMAAAVCYAGPYFPKPKSFGLVIDGFGTFGEHLSIYSLQGERPLLMTRVHGYGTSLGLWYQYATAFLGMRMHEDEYKILGYEAHIGHDLAHVLDREAAEAAKIWMEDMVMSSYKSKYDPLYDLSALENVKHRVWSRLNDVAKRNGVSDPTSRDGRIAMGYYVQAVLEAVVLQVVDQLNAENLVLSGGVFHNVKLNRLIMDSVPGVTCVMPLCGDQGNAIGLYAMDHPEFQMPKNLTWGKRRLKNVGAVPNMLYVSDDLAYIAISRLLHTFGMVNVVRGDMEFGPRALCNTSTFALPSLENVALINAANDRNTIMPMAPCMTQQQYMRLFERTDHVWKSAHHMIMAMEYKEHPLERDMGICHPYTWPHNHQTGRPQIVDPDDRLMAKLLNEFGPLINTSFNYHGKPIALGMESVVDSHMMQYRRDNNFFTVVITNE